MIKYIDGYNKKCGNLFFFTNRGFLRLQRFAKQNSEIEKPIKKKLYLMNAKNITRNKNYHI